MLPLIGLLLLQLAPSRTLRTYPVELAPVLALVVLCFDKCMTSPHHSLCPVLFIDQVCAVG